MSHTKPIDLGRKLNDIVGIRQADFENKVHYPDLHLSDVDDPRLLDMPDEGTCEIHYKIVHRTHTEDAKGNGKTKEHRCSITMEVRKIEPGHDPKFNHKKKDSDGGARKALSEYFKDK
jgi:hypothetical protein